MSAQNNTGANRTYIWRADAGKLSDRVFRRAYLVTFLYLARICSIGNTRESLPEGCRAAGSGCGGGSGGHDSYCGVEVRANDTDALCDTCQTARVDEMAQQADVGPVAR